jgi:hypothetical protein
VANVRCLCTVSPAVRRENDSYQRVHKIRKAGPIPDAGNSTASARRFQIVQESVTSAATSWSSLEQGYRTQTWLAVSNDTAATVSGGTDLRVITGDRRASPARFIYHPAAPSERFSTRPYTIQAAPHRGAGVNDERRRGTCLACGPHFSAAVRAEPSPWGARRPRHPNRQICAQTLAHLTVLTEIHTRRYRRWFGWRNA